LPLPTRLLRGALLSDLVRAVAVIQQNIDVERFPGGQACGVRARGSALPVWRVSHDRLSGSGWRPTGRAASPAVNCRQAETLVLDDSYHIVTIDRQRQLVVDRTLEFVSQIDRNAIPTLADEDTFDWLLNTNEGGLVNCWGGPKR
jgi:hypothetical protein